MKKLLCGILVLMLSQHLYANMTTIVKIDRNADVVTCVDYNGYVWEFYGCEDWCEGDLCNLVMYDNMTDRITDDVIVRKIYERMD